MEDTVESRRRIGFPRIKEAWNRAPAIFQEHTLRIAGHPVMEDWEEGYMLALSKIATSKGGTILELGYGMGISAKAIQSQEIESHFVVECHPAVIAKAQEDFKDAIAQNRFHVLSGFWQDVTPNLKTSSFDGILFDTYPLTEEEIHSNHFDFFNEAYRLLKPGGVLTYYSDEATDFSEKHLQKLLDAGFKREDITFEVCDVDPPENCEYWTAKTMLVPIVVKN
jgi:guanidinoacetate N-methyltransferase